MSQGLYNSGMLLVGVLFVILLLIFFIKRRQVKAGEKELRAQEELLLRQAELMQIERKKMASEREEVRRQLERWMANYEKKSQISGKVAETTENQVDAQHQVTEDDLLPDEHQATEDDLLNYQRRTLEELTQEPERVYFTNPLLNSMIRQKLDDCKAAGIRVEIQGVPEGGIDYTMDQTMELLALFGNLIDNAIEACMLIPDTEKRWICASFTVEEKPKKRIHFVSENSCNESSLQKAGQRTWKKEAREHGVGQDIIRDIVAGQRGWISMERKDDTYRVEMRLPLNGRE